MTFPADFELPVQVAGATMTIDVGVWSGGMSDDPSLEQVPLGAASNGGSNGCRIWTATDGRVLICHDGIGMFEVTNGDRIVIRPRPGADPRRIRAALHSSVPSVVLAQRGRFALHASTVAVDGTGIAIAGGNGVGKSTTALAMVTAGATPIVDDVTVLDPEPVGAPTRVVTRSLGGSARVFPHVLTDLGLDTTSRGVPGVDGKVEIAWPTDAAATVRLVVVVRPAAVARPEFRRPTPVRVVRTLSSVTHLGSVAHRIGERALFHWHTSVASTTDVVVLLRPATGWPVEDLCHRLADLATDHSRAHR
jgi:hypothetical protein